MKKKKGESHIKSKVKTETTWRIKGKSKKEAEDMKRQTERMGGRGEEGGMTEKRDTWNRVETGCHQLAQ